MRRGRRIYYDLFSRFYDGFVSLHSRDKQGAARKFLVNLVPKGTAAVLDLCTGTGTILPLLQNRLGTRGRVVGADFSRGMLQVASTKISDFPQIELVECDVSRLPFPNETFDVVTCSHAFYELKGETQDLALKEITRVLTPNGVFLMMEHDVPLNPIVRLLFYIRLASMGALGAISFLRHEEQVLESHFGSVSKVLAPAGRSKVMACKKALRGLAAVGMPSESALPQEGRH